MLSAIRPVIRASNHWRCRGIVPTSCISCQLPLCARQGLDAVNTPSWGFPLHGMPQARGMPRAITAQFHRIWLLHCVWLRAGGFDALRAALLSRPHAAMSQSASSTSSFSESSMSTDPEIIFNLVWDVRSLHIAHLPVLARCPAGIYPPAAVQRRRLTLPHPTTPIGCRSLSASVE